MKKRIVKKVVPYTSKAEDKLVLFIGTEEECYKWIMSQASEHIKYTKADGTEVMLVREVDDPDGIAYDVGQAVMYQIVEADGNDTEGIEKDL